MVHIEPRKATGWAGEGASPNILQEAVVRSEIEKKWD